MIVKSLVACLVLAVLLVGCRSAPAPLPAAAPAQSAEVPGIAPTTVPRPVAAPAMATPVAQRLDWSEFSFDEVITGGDQTIRSRWLVKNGRVRIETDATGKKVVSIGDPSSNTGYVWTEGESRAMKMSYEQFQEEVGSVPDPQELSRDAMQGEAAGADNVDGQACDVYEIVGSAAALRIWVSRSNGFPVRSEITSAEGTVTTEFQNVRRGNVPESAFELPPGMQVVDVPPRTP